MINRIRFWLTVTFLTLRTPNWIIKTFGKICELDLDEAIDTPFGELKAKASTIFFQSLNGNRFVMSETTPGEIYVKIPGYNETFDDWVEVYRHNKHIRAFEWVNLLKSLHTWLKLSGTYKSQQGANLLASSQGTM